MKREDRREYLKENPIIKKRLRIIGFSTLIPGIICLVVSMADLFSATGFHDTPDLFWLSFVGMPLIFVGFVCLGMGYMGEVGKYQASQIAPVAKDTINYMIDGTKDEISDLIRKVKSDDKVSRNCRYCGDTLEINALFCDHCGKKVSKTCGACNEENSDDARFCKSCGKTL
jgi:hypothetical protein